MMELEVFVYIKLTCMYQERYYHANIQHLLLKPYSPTRIGNVVTLFQHTYWQLELSLNAASVGKFGTHFQ